MTEVVENVAETLCVCGAVWSWPLDEHRPGVDQEHQPGTPTDSVWHPLTLWERFRVLPGIHDLWFLTYYVGIRDRMRCPKCRAVGTWKMHGSLLERWIYKDIHVRRWLCKWCGHYIGPRGRVVAYPDMQGSKAWALPEPGVPRQLTPAEVVRDQLSNAWPWRG